MSKYKIPFNKPNFDPKALSYINEVVASGHVSGDGKYTALCNNFIKEKLAVKTCLITHSCSASLEMSALLIDAKIGDEVIMPSYTFVSTANAFVLRELVPVFVDIRLDNCNIDENLIEKAITNKTKAIVVVHYAGVACEMDKIMALAKKYNLLVIEDSAQAFDAKYRGQFLGTIGDVGCFSFHETKNIISGEGGAIITNNEEFADHAHIIREKGTNRTKFFKGLVDKYSWVDQGSSYLPSDLISAFLYSNLEICDKIKQKRLAIWQKYFEAFSPYFIQEKLQLP
ncbi:MAG: dTDP-4-amino-4,6-dideoxygalactose transaminase, partial [Alphaproteobacteria bacterium]